MSDRESTVPSKRERPSRASADTRSRLSSRLVEQQQGHPAQLEQQDLQPRLLPTAQRLEHLLRALDEAVAVERAAARLPREPGAVVVTAMQDVEQGATQQSGMLVRLRKPARNHSSNT